MDSLIVDQSLCRNDGVCVKVCPIGVLELRSDAKGPQVIEARRKHCVDCGHCVAVCPVNAVHWSERQQPAAIADLAARVPSAEQTLALLKGRRSIRNYKKAEVPQSVIAQALDMARYAPTGHNRQPVSWVVVSGRDKVHTFCGTVVEWMRKAVTSGHPAASRLGFAGLVRRWDAGDDQIGRDAPHLVFAHGPSTESTAPGSCMIALTYLQLAAMSLGLGSCWGGYIMIALGLEPSLGKFIELPEGHQAYAVSMLGYPQYEYQSIPERTPLRVNWL